MSFELQFAAAQRGRTDPDSLDDLARSALAEGEEERALTLLRAAAERNRSALLWQWTALLQRSLDQHADALACFERATRLDPANAGIAHGHARTALEAGVDARDLFERARRLAPSSGPVILGQAAARLATGEGQAAADELDAILEQSPAWIEGHEQLAQLRSLLGNGGSVTASLDRAVAAYPKDPQLWRALFDMHIRREDYAALVKAVAEAPIADALRLPYQAIAAAETGEVDHADRMFAMQPGLGIWRIRHALRQGRIGAALALIDDELKTDGAQAVWPYAATAWRMSDDRRAAWLDCDGALVRTVSLDGALRPLDDLAGHLRALHRARGTYLDQSVRGGTQTDGPLFSRIDPQIQTLRRAVVAAVRDYVSALPPPDADHPLLRHRRDRRIRFAGSWSVRLKGQGHHSNHVHPMGWISSALYVALPEAMPDQAGWLTLGQLPEQLDLALAPTQMIEPVPARLVLFPSWLWHGTRPFPEGERLTVAFDVAAPR